MLAARFRWAQVLLRAIIDHGVALQRRFSKASTGARIAITMAGAAVIAALAFLMLR
jgi:hypothetical protein